MASIKITHDIKDTVRMLDDKVRKQVGFATAVALTKTAQAAQRELVQEMSQKFDRPTPMVLKSMFIRPATRQRLESMVFLKDRSIGGKNPLSIAEILRHQFAGGTRVRKRLELWLERAGLISRSEYIVPGAAARLDRYGNLSRGQIQQIMSQLRVGSDPYSYSSKSKRSRRNVRAAGEMFWSRGDTLPRGAWMRAGRNVKPLLIVVKRAQYSRRINMEATVDTVIRKHFNRFFDDAFAQAMRTAR